MSRRFFHGPGELLAWSRILNDIEVLIAVNTNGVAGRGGRIELDPRLRPAGSMLHGGGQVLAVQSMGEGDRVFVDVGVLAPAEVMIMV